MVGIFEDDLSQLLDTHPHHLRAIIYRSRDWQITYKNRAQKGIFSPVHQDDYESFKAHQSSLLKKHMSLLDEDDENTLTNRFYFYDPRSNMNINPPPIPIITLKEDLLNKTTLSWPFDVLTARGIRSMRKLHRQNIPTIPQHKLGFYEVPEVKVLYGHGALNMLLGVSWTRMKTPEYIKAHQPNFLTSLIYLMLNVADNIKTYPQHVISRKYTIHRFKA
jgi:hypothetical protein